MQTVFGLIGGAAVAALGGYVVGRAAKARGWTARTAQWACLAEGAIIGPATIALVDSVWGSKTPGWVGGGAVLVMWTGWAVCARVAGFRFRQVADEEARPISLDLSKPADRG